MVVLVVEVVVEVAVEVVAVEVVAGWSRIGEGVRSRVVSRSRSR